MIILTIQNRGGDLGGYFAFTIIFSVSDGSEWYILSQTQAISLLEKHHFLAVSDNQAGDYYGFKVNAGWCESKIAVYDHDSFEVKDTEYNKML